MAHINTLIIGLGKIGMLYDINKKITFTHAKCLKKDRNFNLIGGVDFSSENKKKFIKSFKKPAWNNIGDYDLKKKIDFVVIATPPDNRLKIIKDVVKYIKPKVILVEKPVSYKLNILNSIIRESIKNKIKIFVNYPRNSSILLKYLGNKIQKIKKNSLKKIIITVPNLVRVNIFHYIQLLFFLTKKNNYKSSYLLKPIKKIIDKNFTYLTYDKFEIFFIYEKNLSFKKGNLSLFFEKQEINFERSFTELNIKKFKKKNNFFSDQKLQVIKKFDSAHSQELVYNNILKNFKQKKNNLVNIFDEKVILKFYNKNICA